MKVQITYPSRDEIKGYAGKEFTKIYKNTAPALKYPLKSIFIKAVLLGADFIKNHFKKGIETKFDFKTQRDKYFEATGMVWSQNYKAYALWLEKEGNWVVNNDSNQWHKFPDSRPRPDIEVLTCQTVCGEGKTVSSYAVSSIKAKDEWIYDVKFVIDVCYWKHIIPPEGVEG